MRVLIIDDDEQIRVLLQQMMQWAGFDVLVAENGKIAMQMQSRQPADLVITDLIMPEQEGLETISRLKKEYAGIKIIAISGGGRIGPEAYLPAALELGADKVFSKPIYVQEVLAAVKELLGRAS
jgi:DNA-binding response OmpR family regulator